jgi:hypothetical protein
LLALNKKSWFLDPKLLGQGSQTPGRIFDLHTLTGKYFSGFRYLGLEAAKKCFSNGWIDRQPRKGKMVIFQIEFSTPLGARTIGIIGPYSNFIKNLMH